MTIFSTSYPTDYWHLIDDGRVQCDVCPRECRLNEGQRGLCFVRAREGDKVVLTTYGRSMGFCIDPIEKKPLNHFLPGTPVLSFGTAGCNLTCKYCQNWDMSKSRDVDAATAKIDPENIVEKAVQLGCQSVAFTYNDPVIFMEYVTDTSRFCRDAGIKTVAVTAGYILPDARETFFQYIDAANIDLKAFTDDFYRTVCGGHLQPVLDTLEYVKHETDIWLELTTLLIPGHNDSNQELEQLTQWVVDHLGVDVPMHFSAFHPDWKMLDVAPTSLPSLQNARRIALGNGVKYVYTGNIYDPSSQSTYCHQCGEVLIQRSSYTIGEWNLDEQGCCRFCHAACSGVFEPQPGHWGAKRQVVHI